MLRLTLLLWFVMLGVTPVAGQTLTPPTIDFPLTAVGQESQEQLVTLANTTTGHIKVRLVRLSGAFIISRNFCVVNAVLSPGWDGSIVAGATCDIWIKYKPTTTLSGANAGTLSLTITTTPEQTLSVKLAGRHTLAASTCSDLLGACTLKLNTCQADLTTCKASITAAVEAQKRADDTIINQLRNELVSWKTPMSLPSITLPSMHISMSESMQVPAPAGALQAFWRISEGIPPPGVHYGGAWGIWPLVNGESKVDFRAFRGGEFSGTFRYYFAASPPVDQVIIVKTLSPNSLWPTTPAPVIDTLTPDQTVELGVRLKADRDLRVVGIRFWKASGIHTGPHVVRLWSATGKLIDVPVDETGAPTPGWRYGWFGDVPIIIGANTPFMVSYNAPKGWSGKQLFFTTPLTFAHGVTVLGGIYAYPGTAGYPQPSIQHTSNYWVDVITVPIP